MSDTDPNQPRFQPPYGGPLCALTNPRDHRGYPYIVAWAVELGATSPDFVRSECATAERDQAPVNAVYKHTGAPHENLPGEWVTVDQIARQETRERIETYVRAMTDYDQRLRAYRKRCAEQPEQHSYTLTFPATVTVTVHASSLAAVHVALAPVDEMQHHEVRQTTPAVPGTMRLLLDRAKGELVSTDDPSLQTPPPARRAPLSA